MSTPTFGAARAGVLALGVASSMALAEHSVTFDPVDLDLAVVASEASNVGPEDFQAQAKVRLDGNTLGIRIKVVDDDSVFLEEHLRGDRIELIFVPPPHPHFDDPDNYFYSETLRTRYWFPDEMVDEVIARKRWIHDTWDMPNSCYAPDGQPAVDQAALMEHAPLSLGLVHYVFNPFTGNVVAREPDPSGGMRVSDLAGQVQVRRQALTDNGYQVDLAFPPASLGLVAKTGISQLRLRVDVVDVDRADARPALASTSPQPQSTSPDQFESLRLEPALTFRPDQRLPFIGEPVKPGPHEQALLDRVPPYFLWNGLDWAAARIGRLPGNERGHDICTAGIGHQLMPYEAELLVGPLEYANFNVPGRQVTAFEGELIVDGKSMYIPEGEVRHVFALDAATLGIVDVYERRDRGRFSRGPCAAASSQYTDLVLVADAVTSRHPLHSQSTCSGWPIINGETVDDENEYLFDPPLSVDAAEHTLTLTGSRFDHLWTLVRQESGWHPEYRRVDKPEPARPMGVRLSELSMQYERSEIDAVALVERFGDIVGPDGVNLVDGTLNQAVCGMVAPLEVRLALADLAGGVPDCMIPEWTRLPQLVDDTDPLASALRAELDALLVDWRPESETALGMAANYLVGGALLDDPADAAVREIAWETARRMLDKVTDWDAPRRHTETMYRSHLFSAVRVAVPRTWDILLDWAGDPEKVDRLVETALAHYIMQDDRERFETLFARHPLPPSSNLYLLMIAADWPAYAQALLDTGVAWTDRFDNGDTLLHRVAAQRNALPAWITPLVAAGINPDAPDADGLTALQRLYGKTIQGYQGDHDSLRDKARSLIAGGARVDGFDADGRGLLWHALDKEATHGQLKQGVFASPLLDAGIDIERIDTTGTTALHRAVELGIDWLIAPLIAHGADLDRANSHGTTPLMQALFSAQTDIARHLLDAGADTAVRDHAGRRACDYIGRSLADNPMRLPTLQRDYGCDGTQPQPWPARWPMTGECNKPPIVYAAQTDALWSLHRVRPDGRDGRPIVTGGNQPIVWLRVAPELGHVGYSDHGDARILACGATEPVVVREDAFFMDWYPGGERILVAGRNRALCDLYVDGSTRCFSRSPGMSIDIAPDGRRLVTNYGASIPVIHDLIQRKTRNLLDRDGMNTREQNLQPRFLPDGETISFIHRVDDDHWQLMTRRPGDTGFNAVLNGDSGLWKYAWSPDGHTVVHAHGPAARPALVIHDLTSGERRILIPEGQPITAVDWMWPLDR